MSIYSTNNLILSVVGDADFGKLCDFGEKIFSKSKSKVQRVKVQRQIKSEVEKRSGLDQGVFVLLNHSPMLVYPCVLSTIPLLPLDLQTIKQ